MLDTGLSLKITDKDVATSLNQLKLISCTPVKTDLRPTHYCGNG